MGLDYIEGATWNDVVQEITSDPNIIRHAVKWDTVWTLEQGCPHGGVWIVCHFLFDDSEFKIDGPDRPDGTIMSEGCEMPPGRWWKPISEPAGPSSTSCPIDILDAAACPRCVNVSWRAGVRSMYPTARSIPTGFCMRSAQGLREGDLVLAEDVFSWSNVRLDNVMMLESFQEDGHDPFDIGLEDMDMDELSSFADDLTEMDFDDGHVPTSGTLFVACVERFPYAVRLTGTWSQGGTSYSIPIVKGSSYVRRAHRHGRRKDAS